MSFNEVSRQLGGVAGAHLPGNAQLVFERFHGFVVPVMDGRIEAVGAKVVNPLGAATAGPALVYGDRRLGGMA
jgi:hypothetical protein